jgi:hypothetical protein
MIINRNLYGPIIIIARKFLLLYKSTFSRDSGKARLQSRLKNQESEQSRGGVSLTSIACWRILPYYHLYFPSHFLPSLVLFLSPAPPYCIPPTPSPTSINYPKPSTGRGGEGDESVREKDKNFYAYFMPTAAEIRGRHRLALICRSALPRIGCGWNYELSMLIFLFHYGDFPSSQTGGVHSSPS